MYHTVSLRQIRRLTGGAGGSVGVCLPGYSGWTQWQKHHTALSWRTLNCVCLSNTKATETAIFWLVRDFSSVLNAEKEAFIYTCRGAGGYWRSVKLSNDDHQCWDLSQNRFRFSDNEYSYYPVLNPVMKAHLSAVTADLKFKFNYIINKYKIWI